MKKCFILIFFVFIQISLLNAQLTRYPYIQSTTTNSTIVAFKTGNSTIGTVNYGTDTNNLNLTVTESTAANLHGLLLENLTPDTKYYYEIMVDGNILASEYFYTASEDDDPSFSFIHYGDCGYNNAMQNQIGDLMEADNAEFAVVCGDIDQGGVPHVSNGDGGDNYDEIYFDVYNDGTDSKMLSRECHYTAIGNHDVYHDNGATYDNEFFLPHNNPENSERYYSFEWGNAKFIALDVITPFDPTTFPINQADVEDRWWTDFRQGSPQYNFLESELQCNDKQWVFVYFHEGPWTNYWGADYNIPNWSGGDYYQYGGNVMVRNHLVPLFEQYDVDFVLVGHSHLYEKAEKNGVYYITSGSAGDGDVSGNTEYNDHPEIVTAIIDNVYVKFYVVGDDINMDVINKDNNIVDTQAKTKSFTAFSATPSITNTSCDAASDGSATLTIDGPKPPYTVEWYDGTTGTTLSGVPSGNYFAIVRNTYGCEKVVNVTIGNDNALPSSDFSYSNTNNEYSFTASNTMANTYEWNFGEGGTSNDMNPNYTYTQNGTFTVTLTVTNVCGTSTTTEEINVTGAPSAIQTLNDIGASINIHPNPFNDFTQVEVNKLSGKININIYDMHGRLAKSFKTKDKTFTLNRKGLSQGKYVIEIKDKKGNRVAKEMIVL